MNYSRKTNNGENQVQLQPENDEKNKSIDEVSPRKPARRILEHEITEGLTEIRRSTVGLFIAGLSAGLDLGFSVMLIGVVMTLNTGVLPPIAGEILAAAAYSIGFLFVVIGRSELFTEHTTLAILPVLNGRSSLRDLLRLWALVYVSNILGGSVFALLVTRIGPAMGIIQPQAFKQMAELAVRYNWWVILLSGTLAGWLMGLLSWLVAASRETISQIFIILLITTTIGLAHLHHSMAGSIEVLSGIFAHQGITWYDYGHFLLWATLGNIIGGVFFVGVVKYTHIIQSDPNPEKVDIDEQQNK